MAKKKKKDEVGVIRAYQTAPAASGCLMTILTLGLVGLPTLTTEEVLAFVDAQRDDDHEPGVEQP